MMPREWLAFLKCHEFTESQWTTRINSLAYIFAIGHLQRNDGTRIMPEDFGLKSQREYNGGNGVNLKAFKNELAGLPISKPIRDDDARAKVDAEAVRRFREAMNGG